MISQNIPISKDLVDGFLHIMAIKHTIIAASLPEWDSYGLFLWNFYVSLYMA